jgi:hypothetical protein
MAWWRAKKRERASLPEVCFLKPSQRKYIVCPKNGRWPTCDGYRAARRRAILQGDFTAESRAISRAKKMGCQWSRESVAKRNRTRARRAA